MINYLKDLCSLYGASGAEKQVREYIVSKIDGKCEWRVDDLGNIIAFKKGEKPANKKVMLAAHMDEVGMIITDITEDGYLKFDYVGGIFDEVVIGRRVFVGEKMINGIVGIKPIHLTKKEDESVIPDTKSLYIDIGAENKAQAEEMTALGDIAYFDSDFTEFGEGFIKARAIDDRAGCAVMLKLIETGVEYDTWFAFDVQEETGLTGATVSAYTIAPDYAVVIEATTAADISGVDNEKRVCTLGGGAVVTFMDGRTVYDRTLYKKAFELAAKYNIKAQTKTRIAGGNEAGVITKSRGGVPTVAVSVPCRYLHSPSCVIKASDLDETFNMVKVMAAYMAKGEEDE